MKVSPKTSAIGLRLAHLSEMVATRPHCSWLEIHHENFLANPHAKEQLVELSSNYPMSLHTVGISVGTDTDSKIALGVSKHPGDLLRLVTAQTQFDLPHQLGRRSQIQLGVLSSRNISTPTPRFAGRHDRCFLGILQRPWNSAPNGGKIRRFRTKRN